MCEKEDETSQYGRGQSRQTSSEEDITGIEEEHVHSLEEDADPKGGLKD